MSLDGAPLHNTDTFDQFIVPDQILFAKLCSEYIKDRAAFDRSYNQLPEDKQQAFVKFKAIADRRDSNQNGAPILTAYSERRKPAATAPVEAAENANENTTRAKSSCCALL